MTGSRGSGAGRGRVPPPAQQPERGYVWFLESLDAVHRALQGTSDLDEALNAALGVVLEVLGGDGAWLLEPHAETWTPVMERTRPESPAGLAFGVRQLFTADTASAARQPASEPIAPPIVGPSICPDISAVT